MAGKADWNPTAQTNARKHARELLKHGVDLIKIMATGGVMTPGVEPGSAQLTMEEMKAAIDEAHKADRKTATHAQGTQGIKNALHAASTPSSMAFSWMMNASTGWSNMEHTWFQR